MGARKQIRAAGGVVLRERPAAEVAVVHRPRYDDWSLPKGKLEGDESFEQAALREIEEETGWRCRLDRWLADRSYRDHKDRDKLVRWFLAVPLEGRFEPSDEVDEMRWLPLAEAIALLDYEHERSLVEELLSRR